MPNYSMTNDNITIIMNGERRVYTQDDLLFSVLKKAIESGATDQELADLMDEGKLIAKWSNGQFKLHGQAVIGPDGPLPASFSKRLLGMIREGLDPSALVNFWSRLQKNPSKRSIDQLFDFLQHNGIPLTDSGFLLAYKNVRNDWLDHHSGTWENKVGKTLSMPRNKISDDPRTACHEGYHVGALEYAKSFNSGGKLIICKVDPEDVVCVPYDSSSQKVRVCKYEVVGVYSGQMPDTLLKDADLPVLKEKVSVSNIEEERSAQKAAKLKLKRRLSDEQVLAMSLAELRQYASNELAIVGASHLPGGKWALLELVLSHST